MIEAKVIEDSINSKGDRITTMQITLPKVLLAEFNTHRVFSRNFSSSRAIPTAKFNNIPSFEPLFYGKNQSGMSAKNEEIDDIVSAKQIWHDAIEYCKTAAEKLNKLGLHKQWANRLNDWHSMATGIVTSTEWDNWFELRDHEDAQPEIRELARQMKIAMENSKPILLQNGQWHLPYVTIDEKLGIEDTQLLRNISAARCCRVSYLKHDGTAANVEEDLKLCDRLVGSVPLHASPFEHQATPDPFYMDFESHGNFKGWIQNRKLIEQETWRMNADF